ncbi:MAG: hypothetical protein ACPF8V_12195, partial [Luteibaculum sp.]
MRKSLLFTLSALLITFCALAGGKKLKIGASEKDAEIYLDGRLIGNGQAEILVPKNSCSIVEIKKVGFLTVERSYCN